MIQQGLKLPITEGGKEGKGKAIKFCEYLEKRLQDCSKKEGVVSATNVQTLKVDLRTRTKQLGAKEKTRRKKCNVRFSLIMKNRVHGTIGRASRRHRADRKAEVEEANGSKGWRETVGFALTFHGSEQFRS